jgi:hypothetical protein
VIFASGRELRLKVSRIEADDDFVFLQQRAIRNNPGDLELTRRIVRRGERRRLRRLQIAFRGHAPREAHCLHAKGGNVARPLTRCNQHRQPHAH